MSKKISKELTIFHFNDVYNIEPASVEPVGGASRLFTAFKAIKHMNPMVLFSGDCLNPSMISSVEKGSQMLPIFNRLGITCAVLGNHEFDFGLEVLEAFMSKCQFPWLLSNVMDICTGKPLAGARETYMINWNGVKVGFIGLAEEEWLVTLPTLDLSDMIFTNYVDSGRELSRRLKSQGADIVIALTHMSVKSDIVLLKEVDDIDIIFGGHDHHYIVEEVNNKYVVKSGSDFQNASVVTIRLEDKKITSIGIEEITLDSSVEEDQDIKAIVDGFLERFTELSRKQLGHFDADLDGLFEHIRIQETNLGNLIADIMVESTGADVAILNSGTLRSNMIHPKGAFTNQDLLRILPLFDQLCVLDVLGEQLHIALENGVCRYPHLDGRFPQVSGIRFSFDPSQKPGVRISPDKIFVNGRPLDYSKHYKVCVKDYVAKGRDGYAIFRKCPIIISSKAGPVLSTAVQNFFEGIVRPCKSRGCLHLHCNENEELLYPAISHHQRSHKGEIKHIPEVQGRIINEEPIKREI